MKILSFISLDLLRKGVGLGALTRTGGVDIAHVTLSLDKESGMPAKNATSILF